MDIRNGIATEYRDVELDGRLIEEVSAYLAEKADGLTNVRLDIEVYREYDCEWVRSRICGQRPATLAEIAAKDAERQTESERQRAWQDRQAEQLRRDRPDLFQ